jgi:CAAX protease family protein
MRTFRHWLQQHPIVGYAVIALTISWVIAIPLALAAQDVVAAPVPTWFHYLASLGPLIAAFTLSAAIGGRSGLARPFVSVTRWRIGWLWWAAAMGPVGLFALAAVVARVAEGVWPDLHGLGEVSFLGNIGAPAALLLWIVTFGFGEETGWRGFALPQLQRRHSALTATAIVAAVWAVWHAPYWFYSPGYLQMGLSGVPGFVVVLSLGAIVLTWLYDGTGGSVPAVALWHALFDFSAARKPPTD